MTRSERAAERFFEATANAEWDRALALMAPGAQVWQNAVGVRQSFAEGLPGVRAMYERLGPWEYVDVRRIATDDACCEQHTVRFLGTGTQPVELEICVVLRVDEHGLITELEEYFDQKSFSEARHSADRAASPDE